VGNDFGWIYAAVPRKVVETAMREEEESREGTKHQMEEGLQVLANYTA
jgi:hypothetical protein